jgi:hypothetical protein
MLPLGGMEEMFRGELQPPEAEVVKYTVAPLELVAVTVRFEEQVKTIGGYVGLLTVTVKEQLVVSPQVSLAVV